MYRRSPKVVWALALLLVLVSAAGAAPTPEQKCQANKGSVAGKYFACIQTAYGKFVKNGMADRFSLALNKCNEKFDKGWSKAEDGAAKKGASCPDSDEGGLDFRNVLYAESANIANALAGAPLIDPFGGLATCEQDLASCQDDLATSESSSIALSSSGPVVDVGDLPIGTSVVRYVPVFVDDGYFPLTLGLSQNHPNAGLYSLGVGTCDAFTGPGTCAFTVTVTAIGVGPFEADVFMDLCPTAGGLCQDAVGRIQGNGV